MWFVFECVVPLALIPPHGYVQTASHSKRRVAIFTNCPLHGFFLDSQISLRPLDFPHRPRRYSGHPCSTEGANRRKADRRIGVPARDFRRSAMGCEGFETDNLARQSAGMRRAATLPHGQQTCARRKVVSKCRIKHGREHRTRDCFASLAMTAEMSSPTSDTVI